MREKIRDIHRLNHIMDAIHVFTTYRDTYTESEIISNPITFFGFVKHLEIIGEAAYKLTKEFKENHPQVDWNQIEGMRHVMVHGYYQIEKGIVLSTLKEDIDILRTHVTNFINDSSL